MEISRDFFQELKGRASFQGRIVSDSMEPLIKRGDEISVEVGTQHLERFDIIVFLQDNKLICHYVWSVNKIVTPLLFQTRSLKGLKDHPVPLENYLGKVISHRMSFWMKIKALLTA